MKRKVISIIKYSLFVLTIVPVIYAFINSIQSIDDMINWEIKIVNIDNQEIKDANGNAYININNKYTKIEPAVINNSGELVTEQLITDKVYHTKDGSYYLVSNSIAYKLQADGKDLKYNKDAKVLEYTEDGQTTIVMNLKRMRDATFDKNLFKLIMLITFALLFMLQCCPLAWISAKMDNESLDVENIITTILSVIAIAAMMIIS